MVDKSEIVKLVREHLSEDMFLVDVTVSSSNVIHVFIDSLNKLTIKDCSNMHRYIENGLDREKDDFELEVSSPGLSQPFKVREQFLKNRGKDVKILARSGGEFAGKLKDVGLEDILLEVSSREKVDGHKKKQLVVREYNLKYDEIKSAKVIITFK